MRNRNHYTDLANRCLENIEKLKKDSKIHSNPKEKRDKEQKLLDAYQSYVNNVRPQLEDSGIEIHKYNSRIENIIQSV